MATLDEQKKMLIPFVQRAQEVEKAEPKIAYYCRMYALEQGLEIKSGRAPEITGLLQALMGKLEKDKAVLQLDSKGDALYCENFALTVFNRADRVDRAGRADKATAVTFYAASYFFEILRQFGDPQPDTVQKQRYAAWRAAEINRAVKEGRKPEPPPVARADTEEESAMLDELSKLEMASASSAPASTPAASAAAPAAPAPTVSGRLAGLPSPVDDWGASGAVLPQVPAPRSDSDSESLDLPSPPKQRPVESQNSGGVWMPPPPRRLQTFQKVLYLPEGSQAPLRGTVAKVEEGAHPEHPRYLVALADRIAAVEDGTVLAPELATGDAVMYHGPSGQSVEGTVAELDTSHWPPSYLVRLADGAYVDTTDDRLVQLNVPRPRSEGADLADLGGEGAAAAPPPPAAAGAGSGGSGGMYPPPATAMPPSAPPAAPSAPPPPPPAAASPPRAPPPAAAVPRPMPVPPAAAPAAVAAVAPAPATLPPRAVPGYQPGLREITDASKLTKSATSALQFEDVATAVRLLTEALTLLTQPRR